MARGEGKGGASVGSACVLLVAFGFALYVAASHRGPEGGRVMHGRFASANGLHNGADVSLAGVVIGRVQAVHLDDQSGMAQVDFTIPRDLKLPDDTMLGIAAPSMTSANALTIAPGRSATMLLPGAVMTRTTDPVSLEQQVSDYIFNGGGLGN